MQFEYYHVDVFSKKPLTGNGLTVMIADEFPSAEVMQSIAKEMKQFESIFLCKITEDEYNARIFTVDEELDFAGHPILGATAVVHAIGSKVNAKKILFHLPHKDVVVDSWTQSSDEFYCSMNQGPAKQIMTINEADVEALIKPLHIEKSNLANCPLEVCSTGLPYLIVPVKSKIEDAGVYVDDYDKLLEPYGAKFVYVLDVVGIEGRTWDNSHTEDVATGSAAGPAGDYLIRHNIVDEKKVEINQGRFLGRPSVLFVEKDEDNNMHVSGQVNILAKGTFFI